MQRDVRTCGGRRKSSRTGVDVFSPRGLLDWEAVAADNIQFAMLRITHGSTEGSIHADELFETT